MPSTFILACLAAKTTSRRSSTRRALTVSVLPAAAMTAAACLVSSMSSRADAVLERICIQVNPALTAAPNVFYRAVICGLQDRPLVTEMLGLFACSFESPEYGLFLRFFLHHVLNPGRISAFKTTSVRIPFFC